MPKLTVITDDTSQEIPFTYGSSVREILDRAGIRIRSGCRGNGACGLCLVQVEAGRVNTMTENERLIFSPEQIGQNVRLACQLMPETDLGLRIINPGPESDWSGLAPANHLFSPSLFEAFIKLAQYIVRLKTQQDIWDHLGKFITTYFPAEWTAFVRRDPMGGSSIHYCTLPDAAAAQRILTGEGRTLIADVLDSGFLASKVILTPSPSMTAFLPIVEEYRPEKVMLIGHESADPLPKELLNIYLAISGLASTTLERLRNERELNRHRAHLEELVKERTAELEAANKELEAFSYSVSHDLRAPLRSIDGFSQQILEDCFDKLDEDSKNSFSRIRAASRRMGLLIDGLLNLSRVSRSEMVRGKVNLSALAQNIAGDLKKSQPEREVEFIIEEEMVDEGDGRLLYVVLQNLLGNAWKFTERREKARIEFGALKQDEDNPPLFPSQELTNPPMSPLQNGAIIYYVRDNGAGFDMAYANKLFCPFQRLHSSEEFTGTGIGLATIQRIIHRHGGRIWAEGEVGKGAAFYFTLK